MNMQSLVRFLRNSSGKLYSMIPVVWTRTWGNIVALKLRSWWSDQPSECPGWWPQSLGWRCEKCCQGNAWMIFTFIEKKKFQPSWIDCCVCFLPKDRLASWNTDFKSKFCLQQIQVYLQQSGRLNSFRRLYVSWKPRQLHSNLKVYGRHNIVGKALIFRPHFNLPLLQDLPKWPPPYLSIPKGVPVWVLYPQIGFYKWPDDSFSIKWPDDFFSNKRPDLLLWTCSASWGDPQCCLVPDLEASAPPQATAGKNQYM